MHGSLEEISSEEVNNAHKAMKNGNAPTGDDELPIELFKAAGTKCTNCLKNTVSNAWRQETVPNDWQES